MSSLDRLGIRGIRSFDSNELNVIQFFHPLTVIVGHNGSGKTTIIECLKYITTGDMPPNTKGGAFVHDPNLAGETEVKAEVKLRFNNTNGDRMTASRRLQVTKKKTNLSLKTLEGTIAYANEDEDNTKRRALSTRCSDLDEEIPRLLGVSKSILENVIFCHQEESNWPLSEPSVLKKKFDDIFEATKYTKALDQIKSIKKDQTIELKVDRERLIALKSDRDRAVKVEGMIEKLERDIAEKTGKTEELDVQIETYTAHNKEFYEKAVEHNRILSEVQNLQVKKELTQSALDDLRRSLTELSGTREQLEQQRDNFAREADAKARQKQGYRAEIDEVDEQRYAVGKKLAKAQTDKGVLQADLDRYDQALDDRQSTVSALATQHDIRGFEISPLDEHQIADFSQRLLEEANKKKHELDEAKSSARRAEDDKRAAISTIETEQKSHRALRNDVRDQQDRLSRRIGELSLTIDNARDAESLVVSHKQTIQEARGKLEAITREKAGLDFDAKQKSQTAEMKRLEDQRDNLHTELASLNKQADTRAKLALKRSELSKREEVIANLLQTNGDRYKEHVGEEAQKDRMLEGVRTQLSRVSGEVARAEKASQAAQRDLNQAESSASLIKKQKLTAEREASDLELKVAAETEGQELDKAIEEAEKEIQTRQQSIEQLQAAVKFYQRVLEHGQKRDICIACSRGLSKAELPAFKAYCRKQMAANPTEIRDLEEDLPGWQNILNGLRKAEPLAATAKKLREQDLPRLEEELERANAKHRNASSKAEEALNRLNEVKSSMRELESLKLVASDVHRMMTENKETTRDIADLERQLESTGSAKTADDLQAELSRVSAEITSLKQSLAALQKESIDLDRRARMCEQEMSRAEVGLSTAQAKVEARAASIRQKAEAESERKALQEKVDAADRKVKESEPTLLKLRRELRDLTDRNKEKEAEIQSSYDALSKGVDDLKRAEVLVNRYKSMDTKGKLRACEASIKQLDSESKSLENRLKELNAAIAKIDKEENNSKAMERNVIDNIKYRQMKEEIREIDNQIAEKDIEGANRAKRHFDEQYGAGRKKLTAYQAEHAKVSGELAMCESSLAERRHELETEYKDIRKLYTRQLIKVKTADFAIQDLDKYGKALDKAIMEYHGHKMMEINDTAQALWNRCYQGSDIDTIMIKSDSDGPVKAGNRSYNYRVRPQTLTRTIAKVVAEHAAVQVVMVKDQVEMDMRGRCSAGQKVLASIIIRLALAESFGTNCGILALDEPTTNLDRENIEALAGALADIIKERRAQSNFQLIVITHDEDFLTQLGASGALEKYWRVSRNHRQKSTIERQRLDQHV